MASVILDVGDIVLSTHVEISCKGQTNIERRVAGTSAGATLARSGTQAGFAVCADDILRASRAFDSEGDCAERRAACAYVN